MRMRKAALGVLGLSMILGACASKQAPQGATPHNTRAQCARANPGVGAVPLAGSDGSVGSRVALAKSQGRTLAYVIDSDDPRLLTVDVDSKRELGVTPLAGVPSSVLVLRDGRVVVALEDQAKLQILEPQARAEKPLQNLCSPSTAAEPVALGQSSDGKQLVVVSSWGRTLTVRDSVSLKSQRDVRLPREPRAVVLSDDGKRAYVSHAVGGHMSVVTLESGRTKQISVSTRSSGGEGGKSFFSRNFSSSKHGAHLPGREACQGFALAKSSEVPGRVLAPQVLVDPGNPEFRSSGYGGGHEVAEVPAVAVIDEATNKALPSSISAAAAPRQMLGVRGESKPCLLPRAAAAVPQSRSLLVACVGSDLVVEYDAAAANPQAAEQRRWPVASGPLGIAVDAEGQRAVVWSQFDRELNILDLSVSAEKQLEGGEAGVQRLALSRPAGSAMAGRLALGRKLFHAVGDARISFDGRACASCHPAGRDDALTWATPSGPRQTPMLAGRLAKTAPFGWNADTGTVHHHLRQTFQRLQGTGLSERELDALISYVSTLDPPQGHPRAEPKLVARGKKLFFSTETGCSACHSGTSLTDKKKYDVKSRTDVEDPTVRFDTPSLRFVGGTAPYFHDGRYPDLESLLQGVDGTMGHTKHLTPDDRKALVAFLETL